MKKSDLQYVLDLPPHSKLGSELLLIYDEILPRKSASFKKWLKGFALTYPVKSGEVLKSVESFPVHIQKLVKMCENTSSRQLTIVVAGGGSVGDFGGFVASILKRGVKLVHVPSTWLAAIDSAHGGKTALNVGTAKNQIGTFYPADKIFLVRSLLMAQPPARTFEGFAELLKISWIAGGALWKNLAREKDLSAEVLWKYLPEAIAQKYKVVSRDPEEKTGHRHILNLGHTVGHIYESFYELPHGVAVNYGLEFALRWSLQRKIMTSAVYEKMQGSSVMGYLLSADRDNLVAVRATVLRKFRTLLLNDKKKTNAQSVRFVFLKRPGECVIQEVTVDEVLLELCRQKEESLHE